MAGAERPEDEIDPAVGRTLRRLRLVTVVSMAVLLAGMAVVIGVIVYRITHRPATAAAPAERLSPLPPGTAVLGTTAGDGRLYVTVRTPDGAVAILVFDGTSRAYRGRIALVPAAPPRP